MNDDELGRLLSDAFDARARGSVGEHAAIPAPRFERHEPTSVHRRVRILAPLLAAAAVVLAVAVGVALTTGGGDGSRPDAAGSSAPPTPSASTSTSDKASASASAKASATRHVVAAPPSAAPVTMRLMNADGTHVGVGMPVIALFSRITDARSLAAATSVTADGRPLDADWYFERSATRTDLPIEGHLRPQRYWPAHAHIHILMRVKDVSAGAGLRFTHDLTLDFTTGAQVIATVDDTAHRMSVVRDTKPAGDFPVSLGRSATPTRAGIKVIMAKGTPLCMSGPGYHECGIQYTQQLTYDGEYLHSAPWNTTNIGVRNTSNGCTNLRPGDAQHLFRTLEVGDVVIYPNAPGPRMTLGDGYGDWDVDWAVWQTGGLVPTR